MAEPVTRPRRVALAVLREVRGGSLADRALDAKGGDLPPRDVGWTHELVYGTLRLRGRLDHLLGALVKGGVAALESDVLDVLRLGTYQILEMGSVPPYAAISQSVELARWAGAARAAGLVNGVLHSLVRRRSELSFPDFAADPVGFLSTWGSHPRWLVERWVARWGAAEARELVDANNRRPELYLRPFRRAAADAVAALAEGSVEAETVELSPRSVRVPPPTPVRAVLALVPAVVQDPAASLVVDYAAVPDGSRVIDLCSAPGGKAIALAERASYLVAADLSLRRLRRVRENVERLGAGDRVGMVVADARTPPFRRADAVLLDAPCTGTGTLRRHPDGRWRVSEEDLAALAALQRDLLDSAATLVAPGGLLVYSTCSLEPEENEGQVDAFLARTPGFVREPAPDAVHPSLLGERGDLLVLPQLQGVDGSYAARLRRVA